MLDLTCPRKENIEELHNKYHLLSLAMVSNGCLVHLFLIEWVLEATACSKVVTSCLMRLGFSTSLVKSTLNSLSSTPLKGGLHSEQKCVD